MVFVFGHYSQSEQLRTSFCTFVVKGSCSQEINIVCKYSGHSVSTQKSRCQSPRIKATTLQAFGDAWERLHSLTTVLACVHVFLKVKTQIEISSTSLQSSTFLPIHNLNPIMMFQIMAWLRKSTAFSERLCYMNIRISTKTKLKDKAALGLLRWVLSGA